MKVKLEDCEYYKPFEKDDIHIDGIAISTALPGSKAQIAKKLLAISIDPNFRTLAGNLIDIFLGNIYRNNVNQLLVRIRNQKAQIWLKFPLILETSLVLRSDVKKGSAIYKNQVMDIRGAKFEDDLAYLDFERGDQLIYFFRSEFCFGIYVNLAKEDDEGVISTDVARLHRIVDYNIVYESIRNNILFRKMVKEGWFPFISLIRFDKYVQLLEYYQDRRKNKQALMAIKLFYNREILDDMLARWELLDVINEKSVLIKTGIDQYLNHTVDGYVSSIKILITELEGIIRAKYASQYPNLSFSQILNQLETDSVTKVGGPDSLVLPLVFIRYLRTSIYSSFSHDVVPNSRHAYAHGVARIDQYNWTRALQVILSLDQLIALL